jgi:hypothetical protein
MAKDKPERVKKYRDKPGMGPIDDSVIVWKGE